MGLTNSVQPYWRLATLAMQMTPIMSWTHGFPSPEPVVAGIEPDVRIEVAFMQFPLF
ncbi:MAG: hypothetical protein NVSMB10_11000 [Steroidobacteraceae bacterium]